MSSLLRRRSRISPSTPVTFVDWSYTLLASGASLTVSWPPASASGDLLIAAMTCTITGRTWNVPAGWTILRQSTSAGTVWSQFLYRFHPGSGTGQTFDGPNTSRRVASIAAFRNVNTSDPFGTVNAAEGNGITGDVSIASAVADAGCSMSYAAAVAGTTGSMGASVINPPTGTTRDVGTHTSFGGSTSDVFSLGYHRSDTSATFPTAATLDHEATGASRISHFILVGLNAA